MSTICQQVIQILKDKNQGYSPILSCLEALNLKESSSQKGRVFTLFVPSLFYKDRIEKKLIHSFEKELACLLSGEPFEINIVVSKQRQKRVLSPVPQKQDDFIQQKTSLFNSSYTFESFVPGHSEENNLAFYTAKALAKTPLHSPNSPFFIYGETGLGKTHLLHSMGRKLQKTHRVCYLSAERFLYECITAIRCGQMDDFRKKYREQVDVFLVDDIQILEKGTASQEEFFHTFNVIHQKGGLIVCTCDRPPRAIKKLQTRLQTRLSGGLSAHIERPKFETRMAILQRKAQERRISVPSEVLTFIAKKPLSSIREIEGVLNKIKMSCEIQNREPCLKTVRHIFTKNFSKGIPQEIQKIIKDVAESYQITPAQLCSPQRSKHIVTARNKALCQVHESFPHLSLNDLGRIFGGRSHSTVLHALKKNKSPSLF
ncbi:MAG: chromosomal replication initiator protein DnaA [Bdellovibrionales bacterium]|nr:chromosomal replication initiator protein DnaA [Bdellovibrionales bacterium]